jgi:hypothetical protein
MTDELDVLAPSGASVTVGGKPVDIRPLTIGQLPKLVREARPVIDAVLELEDLPEEDSADMVALVLDLIENHAERVFAAASICSGLPVQEVEAADLDEFVLLASKVVEVNRDFFVRKLGPLLAGRAKANGAGEGSEANGAGPTPSSS